jgi:hypothetical protein
MNEYVPIRDDTAEAFPLSGNGPLTARIDAWPAPRTVSAPHVVSDASPIRFATTATRRPSRSGSTARGSCDVRGNARQVVRTAGHSQQQQR